MAQSGHFETGKQLTIEGNQAEIKERKRVMKTRQDYMDKRVSHAEYYRQFVTPSIIALVKSSIGIDAIAQSKDEHFNDIPLSKWDAMHVVHIVNGMYSRIACGEKIKAAGEGNSASTGTCILKQAARMIKETLPVS